MRYTYEEWIQDCGWYFALTKRAHAAAKLEDLRQYIVQEARSYFEKKYPNSNEEETSCPFLEVKSKYGGAYFQSTFPVQKIPTSAASPPHPVSGSPRLVQPYRLLNPQTGGHSQVFLPAPPRIRSTPGMGSD